MTMNPVIHFEMPAQDRKRMVNFYTKAFGWKTEQLGADMGNYVVVNTTENDANGRPKAGGTINGGFYQRTDDPMTHYPSVVIGVDDIHAAMKKVKEAGGKVIGEPMPIPGVGTFISIIDTEGNRVSMLQPRPGAPPR